MTRNKRINSPRKQIGFSLIEILISVFVVSVGILGVGGLQIVSTKGSNDAHYRTVASMLAADLGDRMRSNPNGVSDGLYANDIDCEDDEARLCRSSACTIGELATFDNQEVMCGSRRGKVREGGIKNLLPSGDLTISCASGSCVTPRDSARATHNIRISWNIQKSDSNQADDDQARFLVVPVIP